MPLTNHRIADMIHRLRTVGHIKTFELMLEAAGMLQDILDIAEKYDDCPGMLCPKCAEKIPA